MQQISASTLHHCWFLAGGSKVVLELEADDITVTALPLFCSRYKINLRTSLQLLICLS